MITDIRIQAQHRTSTVICVIEYYENNGHTFKQIVLYVDGEHVDNIQFAGDEHCIKDVANAAANIMSENYIF